MSIKKVWKEYIELFEDQIGDIKIHLNKPVTKMKMEKIEEELGFVLPEEIKQLYQVNNGEKDTMYGSLVGLHFITIEEVISEWKNWRGLFEGNDPKFKEINKNLNASCSSLPEGAIKLQYTNEKWFPITHDGSGNHVGIDYDPDQNGKVGQIIIFGRDFTDKVVFSNSLEEFIKLMIDIVNDRLISIHIDNNDNGINKVAFVNDLNPIHNIYKFKNDGYVEDNEAWS